MAIPEIQTSFAAGELSPELWGHVDFAKFAIGASTCRNMYVNYRGGANSRAGTAFVGYSKQSQATNATGSIRFSGNPSIGDTITLNGVVFTFDTSGVTPTNFKLLISGSGLPFTLSNILNALPPNGYVANASLNVANYGISGSDTLTVTYLIGGVGGDAYTLAASAATPSGATLTGGASARTLPPRLITFQFSLQQGLGLEFGNQYMRVLTEGAFVTETPVAITAITNANPGVVTSTVPSLANGDAVFLIAVHGMTQVNGHTYIAQAVTSTTFALYDIFGNPVDTTGFGTYTSGGTAARIYTLATPYSDVDLMFLKVTQSADVMSICCRNQITGTEYPPYDLARIADDNWSLNQLSTAATIAPPTNMTGVSSGTGMADIQYCATAISTIGSESVASNIADVPNTIDISSTAGSITLSWMAVAGAAYYNVYKSPIAYASTVPAGSLFGFIGTTFGNQFVDSNVVADFSQVPPLHSDPFAPGQALGITVTAMGTGYIQPEFNITSLDGVGATGYGIQVDGHVQAFVFTDNGEFYQPGDTVVIDDAGGSVATGDIDFGSTNPSPGDTITLNGVVFTFDSSGVTPTNFKLLIGGSLGGTLSDALNFLPPNGYNSNASLNVADYGISGSQLTVAYKFGGTVGNSYTLAASVATPSAGTLTGGTGGSGATGTLVVGPETGTYPSVVAYFQERRVYANTENQPDTYWMSQPGLFTDFDSRIPTIDSDAVVGTPWSVAVDGIQFMLTILGGLVALTGQTAYLVMGTGGSPTAPQPITPSSQQALPQVYNGCHFAVPPVRIDYDVYYLQAKGSIIRSLSYNFWINVFTGVDVTYLSSQLFSFYSISAMAWCEEPYKVLWCVRSDGALLSLTTLKAQEVMGWARHDTQGIFVSATAVTEQPTSTVTGLTPFVDALYVATQRFLPLVGEPFMIERMDDRLWQTVEDCWCVDSALELPQTAPNAALTISEFPNEYGVPDGATNIVPGTGYSQQTVLTLKDPTGQGCTVTPNIIGGAISSVTFSPASSVTVPYTNPVLQVYDPGGGTGFSATVELVNNVICDASANVFSILDPGKVLRAGGGVMQVIAYNSDTEIVATVVSPIVPQFDPFAAGTWTMTAPVTTVTGLDHLEGLTVTGLADGNVIPLSVVTNGAITLANPASAVIVGLPFLPQLQSLYAEGGAPTVQGRRKKIGAVTVRLQASGSVQVGTNQPDGSAQSPQMINPPWTNMADAPTNSTGLAQPAYANASITNSTIVRPVPLLTADVRVLPTSGYAKMGQVAVQQALPLPMNVTALIREEIDGDEPEQEPRYQPAREKRQAGG